MDRTRCGGLSYDQVHELRELRGLRRKDSKAVLKTRLAVMGAAEGKRMVPEGDATETSETVTGSSGRAPAEGVTDSDIPTQTQQKRWRVGGPFLAAFADKEVVKELARRRHRVMKSRADSQARMDPTESVVAKEMGAVMFAWVAEVRNRNWG